MRRPLVLLVLAACSGAATTTTGSSVPTRSWRMGFTAFPPRADQSTVLPTLEMWTRRADAALMAVDVPWGAMLDGETADQVLDRDGQGVADYYHGKGLPIVVSLNVTNGLDRSAESPDLVARGRSLTEPAIQALYADYAEAVARRFHPVVMALAVETNLIRLLGPAPVYQAIRTMTASVAPTLRTLDPGVTLSVTVQVEAAWGKLPAGPFLGVEQDVADFPFAQMLGLSSYPGFAWDDPADLPADYYRRLRGTEQLPVYVSEGGWPSASVDQYLSTPAIQARYITRQGELLDSADARYLFQLNFTDLDLTATPPPPGSILPLFATLGLVTADLTPKPSLTSWDSLFARRLKP